MRAGGDRHRAAGSRPSAGGGRRSRAPGPGPSAAIGMPGLARRRVDEREPVARDRRAVESDLQTRTRSARRARGWSRGSPDRRSIARRPGPAGEHQSLRPVALHERPQVGAARHGLAAQGGSSARSASRSAAAAICAAPRRRVDGEPRVRAVDADDRRRRVVRAVDRSRRGPGSSAAIHDVSIVEPWSTATGQSVPRPVPRTALSSR